ncbi:MAG TPA: Hpt domain-containing protein [Xanthobacteraceae bacterium]|jgi:HPt (histidine-containing phosphotransfer) domain-containing protein|nr:Hpt domain-containing protein [Xanthobacteraceae bacterium]
MADPKTEKPAVMTFADHEVIVPPNRLKKAVVRVSANEPAVNPVEVAEAALAELSSNFPEWMEKEFARLDAARQQIKASGFTGMLRDEFFRAAHDIKGEAATFGFPIIEPVADSLCRLIEHSPDVTRIPLKLIDQHVDAIRAIVHGNAKGDIEQKAEILIRRLRNVTDHFLIDENRHRPEYLDGIISPSLIPRQT